VLFAIVWLFPRAGLADWHITPFFGASFGGETNLIDLEGAAGKTRIVFGGTGSFLTDGFLGVEVDFGHVPGFFENEEAGSFVTSSSVTTLTGHVILAMPRTVTRESLRPYLSGGFGLIRVRLEDRGDVFSADANLLGLSVGGGVIGFVTTRTGLRWELRYFRAVQGEVPSGGFASGLTRLTFWRGTMGVVIRY
jgi:hypothetical protein